MVFGKKLYATGVCAPGMHEECCNVVYTHNINKIFTLPTPLMLHSKQSTLAREFGTKLTLDFGPTTVNIHCNVLTFGRIVMSLFPRIGIISAYLAFSS